MESESSFPMAKIYCDMNIYNRSFDDQKQFRIRLETIGLSLVIMNQVDLVRKGIWLPLRIWYNTGNENTMEEVRAWQRSEG